MSTNANVTTYHKERRIAPFFEDAVNQVFLKPHKQIFIMDGPIAFGKTTNFLWMGAYSIAQCVKAVKRGNRQVRESLWLGISESENSAVARFREAIEDATFSPDAMADPNGPVRVYGSHPAFIEIRHGLPDGTELLMKIECRGFNHEAAEGVLRSRSYLGALIPECQTVPWPIVEVARQRTGRWRPSDVIIEKEIDGVVRTLSGTADLKFVLCDANIPARPHMMYEKLYDNPDIERSPYQLLTPPAPITPIPVDGATPELLNNSKYPHTRFERKDVVWVPNPECYYMTKHFETAVLNIDGSAMVDENGRKVTEPWSGYAIWYQELQQSDSIVRRHVLGRPDTVGGDEAIYPTFNRDTHVKDRDFVTGGEVFVGYDPGNYAGVVFMQPRKDNTIHIFHEINFEPSDGLTSRSQVEQFVKPFVDQHCRGCKVIFIPDPYAEVDTNQGEGLVAVLSSFGLKCVRCLVPNQNTQARINCLGYFIDQGLLTVSPNCGHLIRALSGGYARKKLRSGVISDRIDKDSIYSHIAEALQYPMVNLYHNMVTRPQRKKKTKTGLFKLTRSN